MLKAGSASLFLAAAPGVVFSLLLLWNSHYSIDRKIEGSFLAVVLAVGLGILIQRNLSRAVLTAADLFCKAMAETGSVAFSFSTDGRLRSVSPAGVLFLNQREADIMHRTARELEIEDLLEGPAWDVISREKFGAQKQWIVHRIDIQSSGQRHRLIMLREAWESVPADERIAWKRLIQALNHEINNSLGPIASIAGTLGRMASNAEVSEPLSEHLAPSLHVIRERADSLSRFLRDYAALAKLPKPVRRDIAVNTLIADVAALETRVPVKLLGGPEVHISVDPDQLQQALINLVRNAVESVLQAPKEKLSAQPVTVSWLVKSGGIVILICDEGIGLTDGEALFRPFHSTKEAGSGIGLLLSRQIVEAHDGTLAIENRTGRSGCRVVISVPACLVELTQAENVALLRAGEEEVPAMFSSGS